jgi:hypothetical protein
MSTQIQRRLSAALAAEPKLPRQASEGRSMKASIWTRLIATALAACTAAALAAPAWGKGGGGLTLHRDGSQAVPFVAQVGGDRGASSSGPALRRDGSEAVPFIADVGTETSASTGGFDWGDAGIGAGAMLTLTTLGVGGAVLVRSRRHRAARPAASA